MPSEKDNILEFNQYVKYDKMPCIIYADIESLIKKWMWRQSRIFFNTKNRWACSLRIFNINDLGIGSHRKQTYFILQKILHQKFCEFLSEHTKNIIDFEKKKMLPLTIAELKSHQDANVCYICGKKY